MNPPFSQNSLSKKSSRTKSSTVNFSTLSSGKATRLSRVPGNLRSISRMRPIKYNFGKRKKRNFKGLIKSTGERKLSKRILMVKSTSRKMPRLPIIKRGKPQSELTKRKLPSYGQILMTVVPQKTIVPNLATPRPLLTEERVSKKSKPVRQIPLSLFLNLFGS